MTAFLRRQIRVVRQVPGTGMSSASSPSCRAEHADSNKSQAALPYANLETASRVQPSASRRNGANAPVWSDKARALSPFGTEVDYGLP